MTPAPRRRPVTIAAVLCSSALAVGALGGCGRPQEVVPGDSGMDTRVSDLEKEVRDLKERRDPKGGLDASVAANEASELRRTVQELKAKVSALESRLGAAPAPAGAGTASAGGSAAPAAPLPVPPTFAPSSEGTFSDEQIAYFRKLQDEVDRRKSEEAQADRVKRELARAGVTLTADQEAAVLRLQSTYAQKMREIFRSGIGTTDAERQAALQQRDALRSQYEADLRAVVPAADADKIVEAMRRGWPGFFPRRADRRNSAGGD